MEIRRLAPPLRLLRRPALVVWGAHDPYVPVAYASRQREVFPDARIVVLDGSGHIANGQVTAQFQRRAARIVDAAWLLAATEDLRHPEVEGARPPLLHALHAYVERAHRVAARDEVVMKRLCEVLSMTAPPTTLFGLATAVRVLGRSNIPHRAPLTLRPAGARKA